jgi:hypothetical protein
VFSSVFSKFSNFSDFFFENTATPHPEKLQDLEKKVIEAYEEATSRRTSSRKRIPTDQSLYKSVAVKAPAHRKARKPLPYPEIVSPARTALKTENALALQSLSTPKTPSVEHSILPSSFWISENRKLQQTERDTAVKAAALEGEVKQLNLRLAERDAEVKRLWDLVTREKH